MRLCNKIMFKNIGRVVVVSQRTIKNFGHKREPIPLVTTLWQGFLTFTFLGGCLKWERIKSFFFGDNEIFLEDSTESIDKR